MAQSGSRKATGIRARDWLKGLALRLIRSLGNVTRAALGLSFLICKMKGLGCNLGESIQLIWKPGLFLPEPGLLRKPDLET